VPYHARGEGLEVKFFAKLNKKNIFKFSLSLGGRG